MFPRDNPVNDSNERRRSMIRVHLFFFPSRTDLYPMLANLSTVYKTFRDGPTSDISWSEQHDMSVYLLTLLRESFAVRHSLKLVVTHDHMKVVITSVKATLEVILRQVGTGKKVEGWEEHVCYVLQENLSYTTFKGHSRYD
ncbi:unnamed protein product [Somion occarium]|uniref:Uncharacterized protein n=1 Tax=Somion occarium TaxID=3059160 RepID=A0ABP1DNI8_9APHY